MHARSVAASLPYCRRYELLRMLALMMQSMGGSDVARAYCAAIVAAAAAAAAAVVVASAVAAARV